MVLDKGMIMRLSIVVVLAAVFGLVTQAYAGDISPQANREFLAAFAKKPDVIARPSGLLYRVITPGSGESPDPDDTVTVVYKGEMVDGVVFDQTKAGETTKLPVNKVIPGWQEALSLMKVGDEWEIVVPSNLGYGAVRSGNISSNQNLFFRVHLLAVQHPRPN
jgi:FKBP-type peptidyl-prolyl cis-trans isomerase